MVEIGKIYKNKKGNNFLIKNGVYHTYTLYPAYGFQQSDGYDYKAFRVRKIKGAYEIIDNKVYWFDCAGKGIDNTDFDLVIN